MISRKQSHRWKGGDFPGSGSMKYKGPEEGMSLATRRLLMMELRRASL